MNAAEGVSDPALKKQAIGMVAGLTAQYILGMLSNLFVKFPESAHDGQLWEFAWSQISVAAHIIIGIVLLLGSITLMVRSLLLRNHTWSMISIIGFLAIVLAGVSGSMFITSQSDIYSFSMSVGFIVAFAAYFWGISHNIISARM
jgi:hypothetical protein